MTLAISRSLTDLREESRLGLAARGVGPTTAPDIANRSGGEDSLYLSILKAEREFERTRMFWTSRDASLDDLLNQILSGNPKIGRDELLTMVSGRSKSPMVSCQTRVRLGCWLSSFQFRSCKLRSEGPENIQCSCRLE